MVGRTIGIYAIRWQRVVMQNLSQIRKCKHTQRKRDPFCLPRHREKRRKFAIKLCTKNLLCNFEKVTTKEIAITTLQ